MASASLGEAERGVIARVGTDAAMKTLTGLNSAGNARVYPGFSAEVLVQAAYPRITVGRAASDPTHVGRGPVRTRLYLYAWDDIAEIDAMEKRCVELLDGQRWTHEGASLHAVSFGSSDRTGRTPRSRLLTFEVHVT